jgi:hypothetical protein
MVRRKKIRVRMWKTYRGARKHGRRIVRAVCGCDRDGFRYDWEGCGQEWFALMGDWCNAPLICLDSWYAWPRTKRRRCGGFLHWHPYEPPPTYGRNRGTVHRVYECRWDGKPVRREAA